MEEYEKLTMIIGVMGSEATPQQIENLKSWIMENIGQDYWLSAAEEVLMQFGDSAGDIYTEFSMRMGEMGRY